MSKCSLPPYALVLVRWLDSAAPRGWQNLGEWQGLGSLDCVSVGFLLSQNAEAVTLMPHVAYPDDEEQRQGNGIMVIPAGAVTSIEALGPLPSAPPSSPLAA